MGAAKAPHLMAARGMLSTSRLRSGAGADAFLSFIALNLEAQHAVLSSLMCALRSQHDLKLDVGAGLGRQGMVSQVHQGVLHAYIVAMLGPPVPMSLHAYIIAMDAVNLLDVHQSGSLTCYYTHTDAQACAGACVRSCTRHGRLGPPPSGAITLR